jgi:superfamily II DNA helicase RecQ
MVRFERKRQNRKFIQLDLFIEISVGYCFATIVMLQNALVILNEKIYATYYHGGMDQDERERANPVQKRKCELFNHNRFGCGLYPEMNHVIHYHLPSKEDEFTIETDVQHVC